MLAVPVALVVPAPRAELVAAAVPAAPAAVTQLAATVTLAVPEKMVVSAGAGVGSEKAAGEVQVVSAQQLASG